MKKFTVGGVPEHFNLPWHMCIEEQKFSKQNIDLTWKDFPGGTGAMCQALRNKEIDIAIILTEGIIKDCIEGNPSKIVQTYIQSPLIWGIHVDANSQFEHLNELENKTAAISRFGSGSHLMAYINAENNNWKPENLDFKVVKNLDGAIESLANQTSDYFMWEHFTTKPLVDSGVFRHIADCPTPWPCFVIAVREDVLTNCENDIKTILSIINKQTKSFKNHPAIDTILSKRYQQKLSDIQKWLTLTLWSQSTLSPHILNEIQEKLIKLNIISSTVPPKDLLHTFD
ncbi:substrate-binding domain-containing protein [Aquimarina sp. W85]|uniref:substrate-binding domain-containing protein n=1 Tax=Aquimarina rhodophyticola TaxID=3342246 RepID=UPI00367198A4